MTEDETPNTESILVLEDDLALNRRIQDVLGTRWRVAGALDGAEALGVLAEDHYDLLVLDLQLPDRDGLELLADIERQGLVSRAVVLTGHGDQGRAVQALRLHCVDFLAKPVEPDVLMAAVERALDEPPVVMAPLEVVLVRARRLLRRGRISGASTELQAARSRYPDSPEIVNLLGVGDELRQDLARAVDRYNLAVQLRPYAPARRNSERLVFRSWMGPGAGVQVDYGDREES